MIYAYGVSLPGTDHVKQGIVCQDAHRIVSLGTDVAIAAVADGLGSVKYSDVGSKLAVENSVEMCAKHISGDMPSENILKVIKAAYVTALNSVESEARSKDRSSDQYDTTLTLAVLVRDTLYYGHSGDGGIIALSTDGLFMQVTRQQRDSEGRVYPLFFQDQWEFGVYEKKVSAVLLATDGMYEPFFPIYIKNDQVNIHVQLARFFMDHRQLDIARLGSEAITKRVREYMQNIPPEQVNDDKTVAVLINPSIKTSEQPKSYYEPPNWAELKKRHDEEWKRAAYPDMYKELETKKTEQQAFEESLPKNMTFGLSQDSMSYQTQNEHPKVVPELTMPTVQKGTSWRRAVILPMFGIFVALAALATVLIFTFWQGDELDVVDTYKDYSTDVEKEVRERRELRLDMGGWKNETDRD